MTPCDRGRYLRIPSSRRPRPCPKVLASTYVCSVRILNTTNKTKETQAKPQRPQKSPRRELPDQLQRANRPGERDCRPTRPSDEHALEPGPGPALVPEARPLQRVVGSATVTVPAT